MKYTNWNYKTKENKPQQENKCVQIVVNHSENKYYLYKNESTK